jgi:hypothetical protein
MKLVRRLILGVCILTMCGVISVSSKQLVILWEYHNPGVSSWVPVGMNQWGGYDYSCTGIIPGACNTYDWKAIYYYNVQPPSLPPSASATIYPDAPRQAFMQAQGEIPPSSLPTPTVTLTEEN